MLPLSTSSKACRTRKVTESTGRSYLKTRNWTPARQACTAEKSQWICLQSVQHAQLAITTYRNDTQEQGQNWRLGQHELQKPTRELSATRFDTVVQLCAKTASFSLLKSTANQVLLATTSCFSPRMQNQKAARQTCTEDFYKSCDLKDPQNNDLPSWKIKHDTQRCMYGIYVIYECT